MKRIRKPRVITVIVIGLAGIILYGVIIIFNLFEINSIKTSV